MNENTSRLWKVIFASSSTFSVEAALVIFLCTVFLDLPTFIWGIIVLALFLSFGFHYHYFLEIFFKEASQ